MPTVLFLLRRSLLPKEGNLLGFALWVSVSGVSLGIAVLILVLSVMSGFQEFLESRYTRITSDIVVIPKAGTDGRDLEAQLQKVEGVEAVAPFLMGQGMVFKKSVGGAVIEGIQVGKAEGVTPWSEIWLSRPDWERQKANRHWIWLGRGLAEKLKVGVGDTVSLMIGEGKNGVIPFEVTALTKFGIYDHDLRYAYVDLKEMEKLFPGMKGPNYKIKLKDKAELNLVAANLKKNFGVTSNIRRWNDINQNIFLAVAHQKQMLFVVLEVVVALAGVNVINLLMMSSYFKRRDTAILRALGLKFKEVVFFFTAQGAVIGLLGIFLGIVIGWVLCWVVERVQPPILSEAIYNVSRPPIRMEAQDVFLISSVAFILCVFCSLIPAIRAARQRPVEAIREEA